MATDTVAGAEVRREGPVRWLLRTSFPTARSLVLALLVCVAAPVALVAVHIHENPMFSPLDEAAHFDYVNRIAQGDIPRLGQPMLPSTLRTVACRGSALAGAIQPPCDQKVIRPDEFGGGGLSYEAQQPPAYYAITVPFRWLAVHVGGLSPLSGTRAVGALWLVAGLVLFWTAGRVLDLEPATVGIGVLLLGAAPVAVYSASDVTNDAASIFAGALVALVGALAWKRPGRWAAPALLAAGFFVPLLKATDVLPVVVGAAMFALLAWSRRPAGSTVGTVLRSWWREWWRYGGMLLLGGAVSLVLWIVVSRELAIINPKVLPTFNVLRGYPVGILRIAHEALTMFGPLTNAYTAFRSNASATVPAISANWGYVQSIMYDLLEYLLIAGGLAGLFIRPRRWQHWLGLITLPALFLGGVVLGIGLWLTYNADPGLSGRYGLPLAPFLVLALVAAVRGAWIRWGLWVFAVAALVLDFCYMLVR